MYIYGWKFPWDTAQESRALHEFSDESMERSVRIQ